MPYTVWSHGRMFGTSDLGYRRIFRKHRMGDFHPTEAGEKVMAIATGVSPAGIQLVRMLAASPRPSDGLVDGTIGHTSEYADFAAAESHRDALDLELRGPDGSVIATEWIDLRDTHFLLSLEDEGDLGMDTFGLLSDDLYGEEGGNTEGDWQHAENPWNRHNRGTMMTVCQTTEPNGMNRKSFRATRCRSCSEMVSCCRDEPRRGQSEEKKPRSETLQGLIFTQSGRRDLIPRPPEPHSFSQSYSPFH